MKSRERLIRRLYFLVIGKNIKSQNLLKKRHAMNKCSQIEMSMIVDELVLQIN